MKNNFEEQCEKEERSKQWLSTAICQKHLVTTCYRQSSCIYPTWFYETFIWEIKEQQERDLIGDATGYGLSHFQICQWIIDNNGWDSDKFIEYVEEENGRRSSKAR